MSSDLEIEKEILEKGLTSPRINLDRIDQCIDDHTFVVAYGVLTICIIRLKNGFTVIGESACVSPENYDKEIGEKIAFRNAKDKIWLLEGYLLRHELHQKEVNVQ